MSIVARILAIVFTMAVIMPLHAGTARACSCHQPTVEEALQSDQYEDSAVAVVRRIDDGTTIHGRAEVVMVLGGALPDIVDVTFDDGGSCQPYIAVGQTAGLLVDTSGPSPVVGGCSLLDPTSVIQHLDGPLTIDPQATGPPALVVAGDLPGATLALLDDQLRTLRLIDTGGSSWRLVGCEDQIAVLRAGQDIDMFVDVFDTDLQASASTTYPGLLNRPFAELACTAMGVGLLANGSTDDGGGEFRVGGTGVLYPDATSADPPVEVPGFTEGSLAGNRAVLLTRSEDDGSQVTVVDLDGAVRTTVDIPNDRLYDLALSPSGNTLVAWGADGVVLTVDTADGRVIARDQLGDVGWAGSSPWIAEDRLALVHYGESGLETAPVVTVRDIDLDVVEAYEGLTAHVMATTAGLLAVTDDGLGLLDSSGIVATADRQTSVADAVAALGPLDVAALSTRQAAGSADDPVSGESTATEIPPSALDDPQGDAGFAGPTTPATITSGLPIPSGGGTQAGAVTMAVLGGLAVSAVAIVVVGRRRSSGWADDQEPDDQEP